MPIDSISQARLNSVHPILNAVVGLLVLDFEAAEKGDSLIVVQGKRDWSDQEGLWLQGRNGSGEIVDPGKVVTNAPPGHSWHEFGMAVDLVPNSLIGIRGWQPTSPLWKIIADLAKRRGLTSGFCWHHEDLPHVQLTGKFGVSPDDSVRKMYFANGGRLQPIWDASGIDADFATKSQTVNT